MKVLMLNGSWNQDGSTKAGLDEMAKVFAAEGVETEIVTIGGKPIADCIACGKCAELKHCVFENDGVNGGRIRLRLAGLLRASVRTHPELPRQALLLDDARRRIRRVPPQARRVDRRCAPCRNERVVRRDEQVRDHLADDRRREQLLERVPRAHEGRRAAGSRRSSDAAQPRAQHGLRDEMPEGRTRRRHSSAGKRKRAKRKGKKCNT